MLCHPPYSLVRMESTALETTATALPGLSKGLPPGRQREVLVSVETTAAGLITSGAMTPSALEHVAAGLLRLKHRPSDTWLEAAQRFAEGCGDKKCLDLLQTLGRL